MSSYRGQLPVGILLIVSLIIILCYTPRDYDVRSLPTAPPLCVDEVVKDVPYRVSADFSNLESHTQRKSSLQFDYSRPGKTLWSGDPQCSKYLVFFGKNMKSVQLFSYPRSGNTWTRYLLEASTGMYTGSIYTDSYLAKKGYLGETERPEAGTTLVVKSHRLWGKRDAILLIRNPERACVSYWNYKVTARHLDKFTNSVRERSYNTTGFHGHVKSCIYRWKTVALNGLKMENVLPIYYEYLRNDPLKYVRKMMEFLHVTPEEDRLECVKKYPEGPAKGGQRTIDPFTQEEKNAFARVIAEVGRRLHERGFSPLPNYKNYKD